MGLIGVKCRYDKNPFSIVKVRNSTLVGDSALLVCDDTLYMLVAVPLVLVPPSLSAAGKWPPFLTIQEKT